MAGVNHESHMRAALAEAAAARAVGEHPDGAVAVVDEAMVASARPHVVTGGDPTAHAVMCVVREAARRLGRPTLEGVTVFSVVEPCAMCVGALLQSDADGLVFALRDPVSGACGSALQLAEVPGRRGRLRVVSGILRDDAAELRPDLETASGGLDVTEVSTPRR
jgi:tRNA(adenine34) deaminase